MKQFSILGLLVVAACLPPAKVVLENSAAKIKSLRSGDFDIYTAVKMKSAKDSLRIFVKDVFKIKKEDSVFHRYFRNEQGSSEDSRVIRLYNGEYFAQYTWPGHEGVTKSVKKYGKDIQADLISMLSYVDLFPFALNKADTAFDISFAKVTRERVLSQNCYRVQCTGHKKNIPVEGELATVKYQVWISGENGLPVKTGQESLKIINGQLVSWQNVVSRVHSRQINPSLAESEFLLPQGLKLQTHEEVLEKIEVRKALKLAQTGSPAPDIELVDMDSSIVRFSSMKGKIILMDFFFFACQPCKKLFPKLSELQAKYGASRLKVIGVNPIDKKIKFVKSEIAAGKIDYDIFLAEKKEAYGKYLINGYPSLFLISADGRIIFSHAGYREGDELIIEQAIIKALGNFEK